VNRGFFCAETEGANTGGGLLLARAETEEVHAGGRLLPARADNN
jgi:hypothetical protein